MLLQDGHRELKVRPVDAVECDDDRIFRRRAAVPWRAELVDSNRGEMPANESHLLVEARAIDDAGVERMVGIELAQMVMTKYRKSSAQWQARPSPQERLEDLQVVQDGRCAMAHPHG